MRKLPAKLPPFDYINGREFTEKLKTVTGCKTYELLGDYYGVPNSTFSTWHAHNRTGWELIIRTHIATGASVRYMALGEGEPFPNNDESNQVGTISVYDIQNGQLEEISTISMDEDTLGFYGLTKENAMIIQQANRRCFINTEQNNATSGEYLISIDDSFSINSIQRLPGKKLAISFGDSNIEVSEADIKVHGRVVMSMVKE